MPELTKSHGTRPITMTFLDHTRGRCALPSGLGENVIFKMENSAKRMCYNSELAKGTNSLAASRQYGINEKQVKQWEKA